MFRIKLWIEYEGVAGKCQDVGERVTVSEHTTLREAQQRALAILERERRRSYIVASSGVSAGASDYAFWSHVMPDEFPPRGERKGNGDEGDKPGPRLNGVSGDK